jgi:hypothetical protein
MVFWTQSKKSICSTIKEPISLSSAVIIAIAKAASKDQKACYLQISTF